MQLIEDGTDSSRASDLLTVSVAPSSVNESLLETGDIQSRKIWGDESVDMSRRILMNFVKTTRTTIQTTTLVDL